MSDIMLPEAPVSWNVRYTSSQGYDCQLTLRGVDAAEVLHRATPGATDLAVRWPRAYPLRPRALQPALVRAFLDNLAAEPIALAGLQAHLIVDGETVGSAGLTGALAPGAQMEVELAWPAAAVTAGTHEVQVRVDTPAGDLDPTNDIASVLIWSSAGSAADALESWTSSTAVQPQTASPVMVETTDSHDIEVERVQPVGDPEFGQLERTFEAIVANRGSAIEPAVTVVVRMSGVDLGSVTFESVAPGERRSVDITYTGTSAMSRDLALEVEALAVPGEQDARGNLLTTLLRYEPEAVRTLPAWADVYGMDVHIDAPHRVDPDRPWVPVVVFFGDMPAAGLDVVFFLVCSDRTALDCKTIPLEGDDRVVYREVQGVASVGADFTVAGDTGLESKPPIFPTGRLRPNRYKSWHRILRLPLSALKWDDAADETHLHVALGLKFLNKEYGFDNSQYFVVQRGLRVLRVPLPRLPDRPDDHYFDAHFHTITEWTEAESNPFAAQKAYAGPLEMAIESAWAMGMIPSMGDPTVPGGRAVLRNRIAATDHNLFLSKNPALSHDRDWCPLWGQTGLCRGKSPAQCDVPPLSQAYEACDELPILRDLLGQVAGEEVTLARGPDCAVDHPPSAECERVLVSLAGLLRDLEDQSSWWSGEGWAATEAKALLDKLLNTTGLKARLNFGMHLLAFDAPHVEGPWHGGALLDWDVSLWAELLEKAGAPLGLLLLNQHVEEPSTARLQDVLFRFARPQDAGDASLRPDARPFAYAAHPYGTNSPASWRRRDMRMALGYLEGYRSLAFVHRSPADPLVKASFVYKGYQVYNEKAEFETEQSMSPVQYLDMNPFMWEHPTFFAKRAADGETQRYYGGTPGAGTCVVDREPPAKPPSWGAVLNLTFCAWLGDIRTGLRYELVDEHSGYFHDDDPGSAHDKRLVFIRKVFAVGGTDAHGDFNYVTGLFTTLATAFAAWDSEHLTPYLDKLKENSIDIAATLLNEQSHPLLAGFVKLVGDANSDNAVASVKSHVGDFLGKALASGVGPKAFSNAFGMIRTLALVDPSEAGSAADPAERAVDALRSGRSLVTDGPLVFLEADAQTAYALDDAGERTWDDAWTPDAKPGLAGSPKVLNDGLVGAEWRQWIAGRFTADGEIGGRGTFDAERTMLLPVVQGLDRLGAIGAAPPYARLQLAGGSKECAGLPTGVPQLWRVTRYGMPQAFDVHAQASGGYEYFQLPHRSQGLVGAPLQEPFALVSVVYGESACGPGGKASRYRGFTNPVWVVPAVARVRERATGVGPDGQPILTGLRVEIDFGISMGGAETVTLHRLDGEGRSSPDAVQILVLDPDDRDNTDLDDPDTSEDEAVPKGRLTYQLPPGATVGFADHAPYDLATREQRPDVYSFVVKVHGAYDAFTDHGYTAGAKNTFNDFAVPLTVTTGRPGVVITEWPLPMAKEEPIAGEGPLRLVDPEDPDAPPIDLLEPLKAIEDQEADAPGAAGPLPPAADDGDGPHYRFGSDPRITGLACDPDGAFVAALVSRAPPHPAGDELCLFHLASGWRCTRRLIPRVPADGPRRFAVALTEVPDPLDKEHQESTTRYTVAWLQDGDVWIRQLHESVPPPAGSDVVPPGYLGIDTGPTNITKTTWPEHAVSLLPEAIGFVTSDARPDDPTDPVDPNATATAGELTFSSDEVAQLGPTATMGMDLYVYPLTEEGKLAGAPQILTTESVTLGTTIELEGQPPLEVAIGTLPGIFAEPQVSGDRVILISDKDTWADLFAGIDPAAIGADPSGIDLGSLTSTFGFDVYSVGFGGGKVQPLTEGVTLTFEGGADPQKGLKFQPHVAPDGQLVFTAAAVPTAGGAPSIAFQVFYGPVGDTWIPLTSGTGPPVFPSACLLRAIPDVAGGSGGQ